MHGSDFQKELLEPNNLLAVMMKEKVDSIVPTYTIPDVMQSFLLQDFNDLIHSKLPNSLPPFRDIQHHTDLILSVPLTKIIR